MRVLVALPSPVVSMELNLGHKWAQSENRKPSPELKSQNYFTCAGFLAAINA